MVNNLLERLRIIDINGCAEKILENAKEMRTMEKAEDYLKENLNGEHLELTLRILNEEFLTEVKEMEAMGFYDDSLNQESEPFSDDPKLIQIAIEKCKEKDMSFVKNVLSVLKISEAGTNYVVKELKKHQKEQFLKLEADKLKILNSPESEL